MNLKIGKKLTALLLSGIIISLSGCEKETDNYVTLTQVEIESISEESDVVVESVTPEIETSIEEVVEESVSEPTEEIKVEIDYNSLDYNTLEYLAIEALEDMDIMDNYTEDSKKIGTFAKGRNFKLIYNENPDYYIIDYYGTEGYISRENTEVITKKMTNNEIIARGLVTKKTEVYDSINLDNQIDELKKQEFVEIHREYEDCYIVETIDTVGFIKKENVQLINEVFVVIDESNQEIRMYEGNIMTAIAPVVTGTKGTSRVSDKGLFEVHTIAEKLYIQPGYWVECVDYYNGGEGIHTAEWRKPEDFGGNTYIKNGSHGCINTPTETALYIHSVIKDEVKVKKHKVKVLVKE